MNSESVSDVPRPGVPVSGGSAADPGTLAIAAQVLIAAQAAVQLLVGAVGGATSPLFRQYGVVPLLLLVATAVVFLRWFRRIRLNAEAVAPGTHKYTPGFAVGGWFIPLAMWWIPRRVALDIWRASGPADGAWLIEAWWAAWLAKTLGAAVVSRFQPHPDGFSVYDQVAGVAAAVLAILVIRMVTARQDMRARVSR